MVLWLSSREPRDRVTKNLQLQVVRDFFLEQLDAIRADEACSAMLGSEPAGFAGLVGENGSFSLAAEVAEELEALEAIFMEEYELVSESPCRFTIHLRDPGGGEDPPEAGEAPVSTCFRLVFTLSPGYPSVAPQINAVGPLSSRHPLRSALDKMLSAATDERLETPMIYELVELVSA